MMTFIKQNKLLVLVAVLLVAGGIYYSLGSHSGSSNDLLTSSDQSQTADSQQLLLTLANLQTIRLDTSIFSSQVYQSLTDFGITIAPEPTGRGNPFAPVVGTSTSTQRISLPVTGHK